MRWSAVGVGFLAILWGATLGVRPVLAYGIAHSFVLALLWAYPRIASKHVSLRRTMTPGACEDDEVPVIFSLVNAGRLPLFVPEVADRFVPDKVPRRLSFVFPLLPGESQAEASYRGVCYGKRGTYAIGPAQLHLTCPSGLFGAVVRERRPAQLTVYPKLAHIAELPSGSGRAAGYGGRARNKVGAGDVALMAREYRPGDSLRRIHWPSTARRGRLTILEYERQLSRRVTIFLDLSRRSLRGLGRQSTLEVAIRAAAATANAYLDRGDRVGLEGDDLHVPAGRGDAQLCNLLARLALLKPAGERPLSTVMAERAPDMVGGQIVVLVVADTQEDRGPLLEECSGLLVRGCQLVTVLLDPASFPLLEEQDRELAQRSVHELAEELMLRSAQVYLLRGAQPLSEAFLRPYAGRPRLTISVEPRP